MTEGRWVCLVGAAGVILLGVGEVLRRELDRRFCRWANLTHTTGD